MSVRRWQVWMVFSGVFLGGAIAGGFLSQRVAREVIDSGRSSTEWAPRMFDSLVKDLNLTEQQQAVIRPMIDRAWGKLHDYRHLSAECVRDMEQAIAAELTPAQRTRLEEIQNERRERWRRMMENRERGADKASKHDKKAHKTPPEGDLIQ